MYCDYHNRMKSYSLVNIKHILDIQNKLCPSSIEVKCIKVFDLIIYFICSMYNFLALHEVLLH
jgi:hypothetical protein